MHTTNLAGWKMVASARPGSGIALYAPYEVPTSGALIPQMGNNFPFFSLGSLLCCLEFSVQSTSEESLPRTK